MTESRSRPQYGEYASPEDQAKAIRIPLHPSEPVPVQATVHPAVQAAAQRPSVAGPSGATAPRARSSRRDLQVTILLLAFGLVAVLLSIPGMAALPSTIEQTYALQGYTGHYGPVALGTALGLAINISQLVLWALTCGLSILALRRHRRAFYIPLIGGFVAIVVVLVLTLVAMLSDPGLVAYLSTMQG